MFPYIDPFRVQENRGAKQRGAPPRMHPFCAESGFKFVLFLLQLFDFRSAFSVLAVQDSAFLSSSFVEKDFRFMWKYTFVIPIQVAKVYLFFICQFSIIRIVRMVCRNDLFLYAREPDHNGN